MKRWNTTFWHNGKDVVDAVIDDVIEKLSNRQLVIYKIIRKSVADGVVETASSIASKIKLSPRTIQRELTRLKELNVSSVKVRTMEVTG